MFTLKVSTFRIAFVLFALTVADRAWGDPLEEAYAREAQAVNQYYLTIKSQGAGSYADRMQVRDQVLKPAQLEANHEDESWIQNMLNLSGVMTLSHDEFQKKYHHGALSSEAQHSAKAESRAAKTNTARGPASESGTKRRYHEAPNESPKDRIVHGKRREPVVLEGKGPNEIIF